MGYFNENHITLYNAPLEITEPALLGVLARYKKAFSRDDCQLAPLPSAFIALFGVRLYGYILSSILSLPAYIAPWFIFALMRLALALIISFVHTMVQVRQDCVLQPGAKYRFEQANMAIDQLVSGT